MKKYQQNLVKEKYQFVALAKHNMGVEEEFHGNIDKAMQWYEESYTILEENYKGDPLVNKFKSSFNKLKAKSLTNRFER